MSKFKKIMLDKGIMHKDLLEKVRRTDNRIDKSLLSKIVNDNCLPTPKVLDAICNFIGCDVLDIYDLLEIDLIGLSNKIINLKPQNSVVTTRKNKDGLSHGKNIYNLTVEINRDIANRLFTKQALRKLGYLNKTDCIRQLLYALDKKYQKILEKEKAVKDEMYQDD